MKEHMTRNDLRSYADQNNLPIYKIIPGVAPYLLDELEPFAYNTGALWNWNAYQLPSCIICEGYSNRPGKAVDYDTLRYYSSRAWQAILYHGHGSQELEEVRQEFQAALLNH